MLTSNSSDSIPVVGFYRRHTCTCVIIYTGLFEAQLLAFHVSPRWNSSGFGSKGPYPLSHLTSPAKPLFPVMVPFELPQWWERTSVASINARSLDAIPLLQCKQACPQFSCARR